MQETIDEKLSLSLNPPPLLLESAMLSDSATHKTIMQCNKPHKFEIKAKFGIIQYNLEKIYVQKRGPNAKTNNGGLTLPTGDDGLQSTATTVKT